MRVCYFIYQFSDSYSGFLVMLHHVHSVDTMHRRMWFDELDGIKLCMEGAGEGLEVRSFLKHWHDVLDLASLRRIGMVKDAC
jgi:hypothetical protein